MRLFSILLWIYIICSQVYKTKHHGFSSVVFCRQVAYSVVLNLPLILHAFDRPFVFCCGLYGGENAPPKIACNFCANVLSPSAPAKKSKSKDLDFFICAAGTTSFAWHTQHHFERSENIIAARGTNERGCTSCK